VTTWKDWTEEQWLAIDYVVGAYTENIIEDVGDDYPDQDDTTSEVPEGLVAREMDVFDYEQLKAFAFDLHEASYNHDHEAFAERMEGNGPGFIADGAWVFLNPPIPDIEFLGDNCEILRAALAVAGITVEESE
jgi:hypothetical protein